MKLFVSYRRAAWSFTYWLVEELRTLLDAQIFVDFAGIDEANFESSLLRNLRDSDAILLIVTEHTFDPARIHKDSDWVRREIREALALNKPIILACHNGLLPPPDIPDDIQPVREMQGIEFYPRYFKAGINELAAFITRATPIQPRSDAVIVEPKRATSQEKTTERSDKALFDEATGLAEAKQFDDALRLLHTLKTRGYRPRYTDLDVLIAEITADRDADQRRWEAGEHYDEIAALMRINLDRARRAWSQFRADYPEYDDDPAGLAEKLVPPIIMTPSRSQNALLPPPFEWIDIPEGSVKLIENYDERSYFGKKGQGKTFDVPSFAIAKYPITNAQFAKFVEAGGYANQTWWTTDGWQFRQKENWTQPRFWNDNQYAPFNRPDHPVVGVSWFEAAAFCLWLSQNAETKIMLPTEQMWQYAAQGDKGWAYPWGNDWDGSRCQNSVRPYKNQHTSPVTEYAGRDKGDSLFSVADMSGNIREWCLTDYDTGHQEWNKSSNRRVLRGGAWYNDYPEFFRVDYRFRGDPFGRNHYYGFRVARFYTALL